MSQRVSETPAGTSSSRRWLRWLGAIMVLVAMLLLFYGGITYFALRSGNALRQQRIESDTTAALQRQLELAQADLASGDYELAIRRAEWIIGNESPLADSFVPLATQLRAEAQRLHVQRLTPTITPIPATPTVTPTITPTPEPVAALEEIGRLIADEDWEAAIPALIAFQTSNPSYQRQRTDQMLYDAFVAHGTALLYTEEVERGIFLLRQAGDLGALSQDVLDQLAWADLYLRGLALFGVDWRRSVLIFADLCLVAPFYQRACERLYQARVAYADQLAFAQDWCPAESYYTDAWRQQATEALNQKRLEASQQCAAATPTPTPTLPADLTPTPEPE